MIATFLMVFSLTTPAFAVAESSNGLHRSAHDAKLNVKEKMSERLMGDFDKEDQVTFLVKFTEKAEVKKVAEEAGDQASLSDLSGQETQLLQRSAILSELKSTSFESQKNVMAFLEEQMEAGNVTDYESYNIVNGMSVTSTKEVAEKIATFEEVDKLLKNETRELHTTTKTEEKAPESNLEDVEWNVDRINAPDAWGMGIDGTGTVVASLDTGAEWDHPGLKEKYRGYDESTDEVDHEYSFYDATDAGKTEAYDDNGHGTHVTGTMVGSEPDGSNQVGVAPGAEWISAKVFDAAGDTTDATLLSAADWILEPGGRVDLAPDVVNNSWGGGPGLDEWYLEAVENWREYGIFPEFSAGNTTLTNPGGPGSIAVPANYPVSFATGATDSDDMIADFSLRGPSPYDEIKPDISAPGVNIRSTVPGSGYEGGWNGTSMAGPAVAAVAAMLRQINANITVDEMEEILINTATPRTDDEYTEVPNDGYGHGIVNAGDAVSSILDGLGTVEGQVTKDGEDDEAPEFSHDPLTETYVTMDLKLGIEATDNVSVTNVEIDYQVDGSDVKTVEADIVSGDFTDGVYEAVIPGEDIDGDTLTYTITVHDFGNNEVVSDEYSVEIKEGISPGYAEDFATDPQWNSFGDENSWEWGEPTSGPGEANTGDHVYATNLSGEYANSMDATLTLPPVTLPEGESYLQIDHWYDLEIFSSGSAYDFGYVVVSTDMEEWTELATFEGLSDGWENDEIDLSEYSGQTIYVGFNATSDFSGTYDGWYIDQVSLTDESTEADEENSDVHLGVMDYRFGDMISKPSIAPGPSLGNNNDKEKEKEKEKEKQKEKEKAKSEDESADQSEGSEEKDAGVIAPVDLPLGATVNILETDRTVNTNPADGTYSITHPTGEFTVEAGAYGFESAQQSVTVEDGETSTANFSLDELPQGDITGAVVDENSGEAIEEATVLLVEDANVEPVETDENGNFEMTAYEGTYTLKVMARNYHGAEVEVTVEEGTVDVNVELEPYYTYPGGEIGYDDGSADNARVFYDAGNGWAVKMSLPEGKDSAIVTDGVFKFWDPEFPVPGGVDFQVEVWDATGPDGTPGEKLAGPVDAEALRDKDDWTVVDLSEHNIVVDGDFYMVYIQTDISDLSPGLATDETSPNAERSYQYVGGAWSKSPADEGNYMIRSRVSYEVESPVISSPSENQITNEEDITIEGTASPTTTAQLMNNGEEVDTVEVDEDGQFSFDTTLTEGDNELTVISLLNESSVGESEPVTVTLDTIAPELTIDNPQHGDKTNRETVTVEGTVTDENLDYVEVNGQKADIDGEDYSKRILLDNGENVIEVTAVDEAGNKTTESVTIDVKYNAPEISNVTPEEDVYLETGKSVKIEMESEPGLRATFVVHMPLTDVNSVQSNPTELPMMEMEDGTYVGYWTVPNNAYADGAKIEVKVRDDYENVATELADGLLFINVDDE